MSFSYDNTLSASRDRLRFLVSDTTSATAAYANEELDGILSVQANVYLAAAILLRQRAAKLAPDAFLYSSGAFAGGQFTMDRRQTVKALLDLAKSYEEVAAASAEEAFDRFAFNIDALGRDRSEYQGDTRTTEWDGW